MFDTMRTLTQLADDLASGRTTSRALVEQCLHNIKANDGEGARVFLRVREREAFAAADRFDRDRRDGRTPSRYAGIPISIKDLSIFQAR
jgi:aspartyl-tRNA(Asn)/glutamyl-tRNA(Gln) amidotransferase subunit A